MIPLCVPNLTGNEAKYAARAIESGHVGPDGGWVEQFETAVAKAAGREWAVATITGTAALHAAAQVLGFEGKTIRVPMGVFPAMINVCNMLNCNIEYEQNTPEHDTQLYGHCAWPLLCDRAPAIGEPPTDASLDCYSFAANKTVTCGHGGAIVGDDVHLKYVVRAVIIQRQGAVGRFNYRMANVNAAIGCAQMERLSEFREIKRRIWYRYAGDIPMIDRGGSRWMATAAIKALQYHGGKLRHDVVSCLAKAGIETREEAGGISLPCSTGLTEGQQNEVIGTCEGFLR